MASVLAVDDSPTMRELVEATLKGAGHSVLSASDGVEAMRIAAKQSVNLVITDVNMPNMDGITLVRELRQLDNYRFTPILVLTTEVNKDKRAQAKSAGATGWMVKPFDQSALLNTVKKVLG
ncbi:MAG: response regulator [Myxococcales bacterium]|nr:response regulator [Myxococcales bacterium]